MVTISGTYEYESQENFEQLLECMGEYLPKKLSFIVLYSMLRNAGPFRCHVNIEY